MVKKASHMDIDYRSFTVAGSSIGFEGGKYISVSPSSAAKKAATRMFSLTKTGRKFSNHKSEDSIKFILRETTRGSEHKTYFYDAYKHKYDEPQVRTIPSPNGPVEIKYEYTIKIRACQEHEMKSISKSPSA
jgi:hypothetical protein